MKQWPISRHQKLHCPIKEKENKESGKREKKKKNPINPFPKLQISCRERKKEKQRPTSNFSLPIINSSCSLQIYFILLQFGVWEIIGNRNYASLQCVASATGGRRDEKREGVLLSGRQLTQGLLTPRWPRFRILHSQVDLRPRPVMLLFHSFFFFFSFKYLLLFCLWILGLISFFQYHFRSGFVLIGVYKILTLTLNTHMIKKWVRKLTHGNPANFIPKMVSIFYRVITQWSRPFKAFDFSDKSNQ